MKTALVTGANRGIGLELVRCLRETHRIMAVCRTSSRELDRLGVEILDGYDATDSGSPRYVADRVNGAIDLLVNNAGLRTVESLRDLDFYRIKHQFIVNALAPLALTQALSERLAEGAKVILISSRVGSIADNSSGGEYGYRMSKSALNMAGMNLSIDLRPRGIAVGILHPGYVRTELTRGEGLLDAAESARMLVDRIGRLSMADTGKLIHVNGETLPW